jgi:penicillin amidase
MKKYYFLIAIFFTACSGKSEQKDVLIESVQDAYEISETADISETSGEPEVEKIPCFEDLTAENVYNLTGIKSQVTVVRDKWGIPHIYASTQEDLFFAEGFVVAADRIIQMHAMRLIASGLFSATPVGSSSDLSADVYMRIINLRGAAQKIWEDVEANEPGIKTVLESFSAGVNAYLDAVKAGKITPPIEYSSLGEFAQWTPVDSLTIGRLQSWDLSFDGETDEISLMKRIESINKKFSTTPLVALAEDIQLFAPATETTVLAKKSSGSFRSSSFNDKFFSQFEPGYFTKVYDTISPVIRKIKGDSNIPRGSNNWIISGGMTTTGVPILANDTHLSLRNPAVFYQVHLNAKDAGGDIDLAGVCFPGIPGIILGHNSYYAWGATVYYGDVTDVYVESITDGNPSTAFFKGKQVNIEIRKEEFPYAKPKDGCESFIDDFIKGTKYSVSEKDGKCILTVDIEIIPHHGPVIPGSRVTSNGKTTALTWRWTGFEPSGDIKAVIGLMFGKNYQDFFNALKDFGVGAQNWVYAGTDNHIAYAAYFRLPEREQLKTPPFAFPPYLPVPGDGSAEWGKDVALENLPHALDPAQGFLVTANNDANGTTMDNDPFNENIYYGFMWDIGFRAERITTLIKNMTTSTKISFEDIQKIQADHRSPLGSRLVSHIISAVNEAVKAKNGDVSANPDLAQFVDEKLVEAKNRLAPWDFKAESGTSPDSTDQEKKSAVAASIFNAWLTYASIAVFDNKGLSDMEDQCKGRILVKLFENPAAMKTYNSAISDSILWDNPDTEYIETRNFVTVKALSDAIKFLSDPQKIGVSQNGGFGTDDMSKWLWGNLHTVTLENAMGVEANIPPYSQYPEGFPRHGDMFNVDASDPGIGDFNYTFDSGPSIRAVYLLDKNYIYMENVIPGGQNGAVFTPHYKDEMSLWVENRTHPIHFSKAALKPDAEACFIMKP